MNYWGLIFIIERKERMQKRKNVNLILRSVKKVNFRGGNDLVLKEEKIEIKIFLDSKQF